MKIELQEIAVKALVKGYSDDGEGGVVGYGGNLDIRPPFQREFVYKEKQRDAVIDTIVRGFPLNVMYWADRGDGHYEIIDGQQRTISVAQYVQGDFSHMPVVGGDLCFFHNLPADKRNHILDYKLMVYVCTGTESEKLEWFKTINIAGEKLTNQELRNAVYAGPWVSDAKRYFSRNGCAAYQIGQHYVTGSPIRQEYLETAIRWVSQDAIENYMGRHQHKTDAKPLWEHFQAVISWIETCFTTRRPAMKSVDWGPLYDDHKDDALDPDAIEQETQRLIADEDVQRQSGIYPYILTRDEKHLNIRAFPQAVKQRVYEKQNGKCAECRNDFDLSKMEADHITPWVEGGKTVEENCQMLCKEHNRRKAAR